MNVGIIHNEIHIIISIVVERDIRFQVGLPVITLDLIGSSDDMHTHTHTFVVDISERDTVANNNLSYGIL